MTASIAATAWIMGIVAWIIIRFPHRRKARKTKVVADKKSIGERVALGLCIIGLVALPALHLATGMLDFANFPFHPIMGVIGIFVMIGFLYLFWRSHKDLAHNWSVTLEIRENHKLVQDGVYKLVRHPMYTSFWLWGIAQFLLIPNWIAGTTGLASVAWLYFSRISNEEQMMRAQFGAEYDEYCKKTGRLFPKFM